MAAQKNNTCLLEASRMVADAALKLVPLCDQESAGATRKADPASQDPGTPTEGSQSTGVDDRYRRYQDSRDVCRHWARGYCAMGDQCAFPHSGPSPAPAGASGAVVVKGVSVDEIPSQDELREKDMFIVVKSSVPCKDYQAGKCHRGDKCKFAHVGTARRASVLCRDWQAGVCTRGDACKYRHASMRRSDYDDDQESSYTSESGAVAPHQPWRVAYVQQNPAGSVGDGGSIVIRGPVGYTVQQQPTVQRIVRYYTTAPAQIPAAPQPVSYSYVQPSAYGDAYAQQVPQQYCSQDVHYVAQPQQGHEECQAPCQPQQLSVEHIAPNAYTQHYEQQQQPMMMMNGNPVYAPPQQPQMPPSPPSSSPPAATAAECEAAELRKRLREAEERVAALRAQATQAETEAAQLRNAATTVSSHCGDQHQAYHQARVPGACGDSQHSEDSHPTTTAGAHCDASTRSTSPEGDAQQDKRSSSSTATRSVIRHDPYAQ